MLNSNLAGQTFLGLPQEQDYNHQLIKFYLDKGEYDLALNHLEMIEKESLLSDSLLFFRGIALQGIAEWQPAIDIFSDLLINTRNVKLHQASFANIKSLLPRLIPLDQIETLNEIIDNLGNHHLRDDFLLTLAEIYEKNLLYDEANDIYNTVIQESGYEDQSALQLKKSANYILLKDYSRAVNLLNTIIAGKNKQLIQDALYLNYLANFSLNRYPAARRSLIRLYAEFPADNRKTEILSGLAEMAELEGQYLLSWFFLNELKDNSQDNAGYQIQNRISHILETLSREVIKEDQFRYFQLNLPELER